MLLQFAVTNFRSFRETTVVSLVPAPGVQHRPGQTVKTGVAHVPEVLRAAVVYGANAAGKSNLIRAMTTLRGMVDGGKVEHGIVPYRLAEHPEPTTFELEAIADGEHVAYGVSVRGPSVVWERLSLVRGDHEAVVFERDEDGWGDRIAGDTERRDAVVALARTLAPDRLFVTAAGDLSVSVACIRLVQWMRSALWPEEEQRYEPIEYLANQPREHLERLFDLAGVGDVEVRYVLESPDPHVVRQLAEAGIPVGVPHEPSAILARHEAAFLARRSLVLVRRSASGEEIAFPLADESDGTRRLVDLGMWHHGLGLGSIGLVDEIERSLHPLVVRRLLEPVFRPETRGQLVCTTHDSWLLDLNLMPPDSVWFAEKDPSGATRLHSLAEFDRSQLAALGGDLERGYLSGRFGAIPFLGDARQLGWAR